MTIRFELFPHLQETPSGLTLEDCTRVIGTPVSRTDFEKSGSYELVYDGVQGALRLRLVNDRIFNFQVERHAGHRHQSVTTE